MELKIGIVLNYKNAEKKKDERTLAIVFCLMVVIGLGNKVFNKLMTIPMYNYANFLNLLTTFVLSQIEKSQGSGSGSSDPDFTESDLDPTQLSDIVKNYITHVMYL